MRVTFLSCLSFLAFSQIDLTLEANKGQLDDKMTQFLEKMSRWQFQQFFSSFRLNSPDYKSLLVNFDLEQFLKKYRKWYVDDMFMITLYVCLDHLDSVKKFGQHISKTGASV